MANYAQFKTVEEDRLSLFRTKIELNDECTHHGAQFTTLAITVLMV